MKYVFEKLIAGTWNRLAAPPAPLQSATFFDLGAVVVDGGITKSRISLTPTDRRRHVVSFGLTGSGKSRLQLHLALQDIHSDTGFLAIDFHRESASFLLRAIAAEENRRGTDLSTKTIIIAPGDGEYSVGLNLLEHAAADRLFVQLAEITEILKQRWHLDQLGARTEELLRNCLHLLADNGWTLAELPILLTNEVFRAACLRRATNPDVAHYFRERFDHASEAMQAVMRDPILNKLSTFIADPRFRQLLGQRRSTFSLADAIDRGFWVIVDVHKGLLGPQATTFASLLMTKVKNAVFARRRQNLFGLYLDEVHNLVLDNDLETLFSEARKFNTGIVVSSQYMDRFSPAMRAALMAVGTHVLFQLSGTDAEHLASVLDGGRRLAELLKNLPQRHMVVKSGHDRWKHAVVPTVTEPRADYTDLYNRCRARWARRRTDIQAEIQTRHEQLTQGRQEVLHAWE